MSWEQDILNASVSVNRCIWALNERKFPAISFKSIENRNNYIIQECTEAINNLQKSLIELNNQINFKI